MTIGVWDDDLLALRRILGSKDTSDRTLTSRQESSEELSTATTPWTQPESTAGHATATKPSRARTTMTAIFSGNDPQIAHRKRGEKRLRIQHRTRFALSARATR